MKIRVHVFALLLAACKAAAASPFTVSLPAHFAPLTLAAADFNGDGNVDVALCGEGEQLLILANDGRGALRPIPQTARCGAHPTAMIAADLDGDGRIDLAVANHDTDHLTVLHNDGHAHFTARQIHVHSNPHPHTVAAADVNGDGLVDLITDSWAENRLTLLLASARGEWRSPGTPIEIGRKPYINVVAADLDGDGHVDLVMPNSGFDSVVILFGDGRGGFARAAQSPIAAGPTPFMVAVADVNGDGRPDIIVANYSGHITDTAGDGITWLRNDGNRHFTAFAQRVVTAHGSWHLAAGDIDGDGLGDAAFINAGDDTIGIVYGSRNGLRPGPKISVMPQPHRIAMADLHHDGHADILVLTEARDELAIVSPPHAKGGK